MGAKIIAGLLAGLPLAGVFIIYFLLRGRAFVAFMKSTDTQLASKADRQVWFMFLGAFVFGALFLGSVAGLVYALVGSPAPFRLLAFGMAVLMTILAFVTRTPIAVDKVFMNFAVAGMLGFLVPLLASG